MYILSKPTILCHQDVLTIDSDKLMDYALETAMSIEELLQSSVNLVFIHLLFQRRPLFFFVLKYVTRILIECT